MDLVNLAQAYDPRWNHHLVSGAVAVGYEGFNGAHAKVSWLRVGRLLRPYECYRVRVGFWPQALALASLQVSTSNAPGCGGCINTCFGLQEVPTFYG